MFQLVSLFYIALSMGSFSGKALALSTTDLNESELYLTDLDVFESLFPLSDKGISSALDSSIDKEEEIFQEIEGAQAKGIDSSIDKEEEIFQEIEGAQAKGIDSSTNKREVAFQEIEGDMFSLSSMGGDALWDEDLDKEARALKEESEIEQKALLEAQALQEESWDEAQALRGESGDQGSFFVLNALDFKEGLERDEEFSAQAEALDSSADHIADRPLVEGLALWDEDLDKEARALKEETEQKALLEAQALQEENWDEELLQDESGVQASSFVLNGLDFKEGLERDEEFSAQAEALDFSTDKEEEVFQEIEGAQAKGIDSSTNKGEGPFQEIEGAQAQALDSSADKEEEVFQEIEGDMFSLSSMGGGVLWDEDLDKEAQDLKEETEQKALLEAQALREESWDEEQAFREENEPQEISSSFSAVHIASLEEDKLKDSEDIFSIPPSSTFKIGVLQDDESDQKRRRLSSSALLESVFSNKTKEEKDSSKKEEGAQDSQAQEGGGLFPGDPVMFPSRRGLSSISGKLKRSKIKRDRRFKLPKSKIAKRKKRKKIRLRDIRPPSISATYYSPGTDEAELERVLTEEINQLFRLLKKKRSADFILRLGSLYVDKSRLISFKIETDHERKMAEFLAGRGKKPPALNLRPAQVYNKKSLKLFEDFRQNYPRHKRIDEVLFFLGFNFYQLDNEAKGIQYFSELERRFPQSPFVYESRFQLGEHYFRLGQWQNSYKYYKKVARNKRGKFYFFALYKMAWSAYKMGSAGTGLKILAGIIRDGRKFTVVSDTNQVFTFNKEAIEDLALFYTYSDKTPGQAKSFFLGLLDEKEAWQSLKRLAYVYRDAGRSKGVLTVFQDLIRHDPQAELAFDYKRQMVETLYEQGRLQEIVKGFEEWVRDYGPKSRWAAANRGNTDLIKASSSAQEKIIKTYVLENHDTFNKTKKSRAKALALAFYKMYFSHFSKAPDADRLYYFYGELLHDSGKLVSAVKAYEKLISSFPKSKYTEPAFRNQIIALDKILPDDSEIRRLVGKAKKPVDLPASVKNFMKVAHRYTVRFPSAENIPSIIYRMASLYYRFNQLPLSAKYFEQLHDKYPKFQNARDVGWILLDIYSKAQDYAALERLAVKLLKSKNTDSSLLKEAQGILEQISFKRAQDLALKGKYSESAELYKKFALQNTGSALSADAFYNAGLSFVKAGDRLSALSMYTKVLSYKGPKQAKLRKNAQEFLAVLNEKLGFYRKAAKAYVAFARAYPKDPKTPDFWYNAGVIFDAFNDTAQAAPAYKQYLSLSRKSDRHDTHYLMGLLYERNRRWQKALQSYGAYLNSPASNKLYVMKAAAHTARIYAEKIKSPAQAKTWRQKTVNLYKKLRAGVNYAAGAQFALTQKLYDQFHAVKLPRDPKKQPAAIQKKIRLLKQLEEGLRPVIRYDDGEWIIASLALTGRANEQMARTIWKAPVPKALDKEGRKKYKEGIKQLIAPYRESAQKSRLMAFEKAQSLRVYSEWIREVYQGLRTAQVEKQKGFKGFLKDIAPQEVMPFEMVDNTGSVTKSFLASLSGSLKYGLSRSDFENLSRAAASKKEALVLKAVSGILNKDIDNIPAINSLALFYLRQNRLGPAELVLNRLAGKKKSPVILNNMAVIALKRGDPRQAVAYLKQALASKKAYYPAQINWGNLFVQQGDWRNALFMYERGRDEALKDLPSRGAKAQALLNNYGIALTGAGKWERAEAVFKKLSKRPSPSPEILLNHSLLLAEKSRGELDRAKEVKTLMSARGLAREVSLSADLKTKKKAAQLSSYIAGRLRSLAGASSSKGAVRKSK